AHSAVTSESAWLKAIVGEVAGHVDEVVSETQRVLDDARDISDRMAMGLGGSFDGLDEAEAEAELAMELEELTTERRSAIESDRSMEELGDALDAVHVRDTPAPSSEEEAHPSWTRTVLPS
ncbi:MAG: hypothetical protein Q7U84_04270, partial [Polynucleobacter sp.]|nr:hypothetical protein [Polynucleobacter sp.]